MKTELTRPIQASPELLDRLSFGTNIAKPGEISIVPADPLLNRVQSGTYRFRVEQLRALGDPEQQKQAKQSLPYFVYAVIDGSRRDDNVVQANGIVFDFDKVEDIPAFKGLVKEKVPWARWIFRSPVDGVKVLIPFSRPVTDRAEYARIWQYLRQYLRDALGREADNTPDLARACFLSWDAEMIHLPENGAFDVGSGCFGVQPANEGSNPIGQLEAGLDFKHPTPEPQLKSMPARSQEDNETQDPPAGLQQPSRLSTFDNLSDKYVDLAVDHLCSVKMDWHSWGRCGMALYNHFGEKGKKYWMRFVDNPHYEDTPEEMEKQWERLKKYPGVGIGTLFYIAGQHGWRHVIAPQAENFTLQDFPELLELFRRPDDVPLDRSQLPGFMNDYIEVVGRITDAREGAVLTAFLPVVAANIGNRVYMHNAGTRHFCNVWAAIIGPSTVSRKTTVINQAMKMLKPFKDSLKDLSPRERNEQDLELCRVTQARLYNLLSLNPNRLLLHMELSAWMLEMNKAYNAGMKQEITDMFDGKDRNIAKVEIDEHIRRPAFSIVGATTEDWFFKELRELADQRGGFLQRFIVCVIQNVDVNSLRLEATASDEHDHLLHAWDEMLAAFRALPDSHLLQASDEALAFRNERYAELMKSIALSANDPLASYCSRIYDNYWFRFVILIHLMKNWRDLNEANDAGRLPNWFRHNRADLQTAREAWYLCGYYLDNTRPFLKLLSEKNNLDEERRILRILQKTEGGQMSHSRLLCKSRLSSREFRAVMESLTERQAVVCHEIKGYRNKMGLVYTLNPVLANVDLD
jgi:hypothetical protein